MKPRTLRYRTFAEIADETAKKDHGDWWRAFRDDYLEALIQDQWSGRFIDNTGQSCVFDLDPRKAAHAPARVTREIAWRMLGCYKPQSVREVREDSPKPWKIMTAAKIEEYGGTVVHDVFEIFALSEADARAWGDQHPQETTPTPQENDERPEYTPPYIAFMLRAVREMGLEPGTRKPKKTIEGWLRENWPDQLGEQTKRKIERMAHLLRHPEDERGGYFKSNRDE